MTGTGRTLTKPKRLSLRDQAREIIRELILDERLEPGTRVNESHLSERLEISRSPIREALGQLEREGFLVNRPGSGYSVRELTAREAEELYVILADLEALAVRLAGPFSREQLDALEHLNDRVAGAAGHTAKVIEANFDWHRALVEGCPNQTLLQMLETLRAQVYRYEYAYFGPTDAAQKSTSFHRDILATLEPLDADAARAAIEKHWLSDLGAVLPQIRRDGPTV